MTISNKTILIISPEPWGINFVSKHHYANLLVEKGNIVFFLNPPSDKNQKQEVKENLFVIDYTLNMRGINRLPAFLRNFFNKRQINILQKQFIQAPLDIVWSFDPYRFQNLKSWQAKKAIYHPVDIHYTDLEKELVESADIVLATSDMILNKYKDWAIETPKVKINHGLGLHFINPEQKKIEDFRLSAYKVHIGYVGNLNISSLDYDLLLQLVKENTDNAFYFIGPYKASNLSAQNPYAAQIISQIQALPNAVLLGPKPSKELPHYMQYLDIFLMVYKGDELKAELANPHKTLEYLSTGKAIVSCYIDEYKDKKNLIQMADFNAQIPALLEETANNLALYNSPQLIQARQCYAHTQSYEKQLQRIVQILEPAKLPL